MKEKNKKTNATYSFCFYHLLSVRKNCEDTPQTALISNSGNATQHGQPPLCVTLCIRDVHTHAGTWAINCMYILVMYTHLFRIRIDSGSKKSHNTSLSILLDIKHWQNTFSFDRIAAVGQNSIGTWMTCRPSTDTTATTTNWWENRNTEWPDKHVNADDHSH